MAQQSFELTGNLYSRDQTITTNNNNKQFSRRNFSIRIANQVNPQYPNFVPFQLTQDRCDLIRGYNKGDLIKVSFNVQGRTWNDADGVEKIFCNNNAWKIELVQAVAPQAPPAPVTPPPPAADDDLPF
jgi:hypothetical protein